MQTKKFYKISPSCNFYSRHKDCLSFWRKKINIYFKVTKLKQKVKTWQQLDTKLDRFDNVLSYNDEAEH